MTFLSHRRRVDHIYSIKDKDGVIVPFRPNKAQTYVLDTLSQLKKEGKPERLIILKARQLGITTLFTITRLDKALFQSGQDVIITADKRENQKKIFRKVKLAYQHLTEAHTISDNKVRKKPKLVEDNASMMKFDNGSSISVTLSPRSSTPTAIHSTELAYVSDQIGYMSDADNALAYHNPFTIETTANGIDDFYRLRQDNQEGGQFTTIFLPRYWDENYAIPLEEGESINLPDEIKHIENIHYLGKKITEEQKKRYFRKRQTQGREVFQENPSYPQEAFLTSGDTVFSNIVLENLKKNTPAYQEDTKYPGLRIYRENNEEKLLYWGVDTAEGGQNGDYSSISIRDAEHNLYAHYYRKTPPDQLVEVMDYLWNKGYWSNKGIAIEKNGVGLSTITEAKKKPRANNIYRKETIDQVTKKKTKILGLHMGSSGNNRRSIIEHFASLIRNGDLLEIDDRQINEMFGFVYANNNNPEAQQGAHDDAILCDAMCCRMIENRRF